MDTGPRWRGKLFLVDVIYSAPAFVDSSSQDYFDRIFILIYFYSFNRVIVASYICLSYLFVLPLLNIILGMLILTKRI